MYFPVAVNPLIHFVMNSRMGIGDSSLALIKEGQWTLVCCVSRGKEGFLANQEMNLFVVMLS